MNGWVNKVEFVILEKQEKWNFTDLRKLEQGVKGGVLLAKPSQQKRCQIWGRGLWINHSHQDQKVWEIKMLGERTLTPNCGMHGVEIILSFCLYNTFRAFGGRSNGGADERREKNWTVRLKAIKSIRMEQPLRKVNFLACKPSHGSSVLWICKCLYQLAAPEEGTASVSTQSLAPASESYHRALGVINLSDDMPLRCLSKTPFPKGCQALSRGSETEGRGKPRACITSM